MLIAQRLFTSSRIWTSIVWSWRVNSWDGPVCRMQRGQKLLNNGLHSGAPAKQNARHSPHPGGRGRGGGMPYCRGRRGLLLLPGWFKQRGRKMACKPSTHTQKCRSIVGLTSTIPTRGAEGGFETWKQPLLLPLIFIICLLVLLLIGYVYSIIPWYNLKYTYIICVLLYNF